METTPSPAVGGPPPKKKASKWGVAVLVIAVLWIIGTVAGSSSSSSSGTDTSFDSSSSSSSSTASDVVAWGDSTDFLSNLSSLEADAATVHDDADAGDLESLASDCATFGDDAQTIDDSLPSPSDELNTALGAAMSSYEAGAQECQDGDFSAATADIDAGNASLQDATDVVDAIRNGG